MELRHLRYFVAVGEEQHYGRAARRLRVAQPALSRQIQDLEEEIGFKLFERLPRGVKLSAAGKLFLEDVRRILQDVNEAAARAARVALGRSGTLRVGFTENASWRGIVPAVPGAATRCGTPTSAIGEFGAVRSHPVRPFGCRLRIQHAQNRSGIGAASSRRAAYRIGRAQATPSHETQETAPA